MMCVCGQKRNGNLIVVTLLLQCLPSNGRVAAGTNGRRGFMLYNIHSVCLGKKSIYFPDFKTEHKIILKSSAGEIGSVIKTIS